MKIGIRTPSIKKSFSARTTGKGTRALKRLTNPGYGKKGVGLLTNPKKATYNKIYNKTTISTKELLGTTKKESVTKPNSPAPKVQKKTNNSDSKKHIKVSAPIAQSAVDKPKTSPKKPVRVIWTIEEVNKAKKRIKFIYVGLIASCLLYTVVPTFASYLIFIFIIAWLYRKGIIWGYQDQQKHILEAEKNTSK